MSSRQKAQESMIYDDFARWIRERLDTGPYSDDIDAARKLLHRKAHEPPPHARRADR